MDCSGIGYTTVRKYSVPVHFNLQLFLFFYILHYLFIGSWHPVYATTLLLLLLLLLFLVVGPISPAAMKAYCTLTPQWSSVIHLQRRCTPSGVRDLC
jgi:hypothetical protein